jgi:hypothetical protein
LLPPHCAHPFPKESEGHVVDTGGSVLKVCGNLKMG